MAARAWAQSFIERPDLSQSRRAECHVRPEHAAGLDYLVAMLSYRQIEIHGHRPDFFVGIVLREDSSLHAGKLAMLVEERVHGVEIAGRHGQIVVEENQDVASRLGDRAILDAAFPGPRFMEMLKRIRSA